MKKTCNEYETKHCKIVKKLKNTSPLLSVFCLSKIMRFLKQSFTLIFTGFFGYSFTLIFTGFFGNSFTLIFTGFFGYSFFVVVVK